MPLKKILIILIILLILIVGILGVYNFFFKEEPDATTSPLDTATDSTVSSSLIQVVSQEPVLSPVINNQKVKYYLKSNGNVFESNFDGSDKIRTSSAILPGLFKILWSSNKDKVIAFFEENDHVKKYFYDYSTNASAVLDDKIGWIAWSPAQDKIVYQYDENISIAEPDGSQWASIFQTKIKNLITEWPSQNQIAIRTRPSGLAKSVVYVINTVTGNFQKILEAYGLTALWSPLGDKLLFSETDSQGKNLKLKIANPNESTIKELIFASLPEKCAWSQDNRTLFCAAPKEISDLAVLPDDYYKKNVDFVDNFWRINLDTEEIVQIYTSNKNETAYNAKNLLLSSSEDYLLFINQKDGLLYSLKL